MKLCKRCHTEKELSDFPKSFLAKDGYTSVCLDCRTAKRAENTAVRKAEDKTGKEKRFMDYLELRKSAKLEKLEKLHNEHKQKIAEYKKITKANARHKRRYQKISTSDGTIPIEITYPLKEELHLLREVQEHKCAYCSTLLDYETPGAVHLEHIVPLSKGGAHSIKNVVWSCAKCNMAKGSK